MTRKEELLKYQKGLYIQLQIHPNLTHLESENIISHGYTDRQYSIKWDKINSMSDDEYNDLLKWTIYSDKIQNRYPSCLEMINTLFPQNPLKSKH